MKTINMYDSLLRTILIFTGIPLFLIIYGEFQQRTLLKDALSLLTIITFTVLVWQFFWSTRKTKMLCGRQIKTLAELHNVVGYGVVVALLFHPFYLILPRFFEKGMMPWEALITIIGSFSNIGMIMGLISWLCLVLLGISSFFRKKLPIRYSAWRRFHGVLSSLFLISGTWHTVDLGRHSSFSVSVVFIIYCIIAVLPYIRTILTDKFKYLGK